MADNQKSGWTEAEKVALLVEIALQKGTPDWKALKLPPGRTQKACMHIWAKMKDIAQTQAGNTDDEPAAKKVTAKVNEQKAGNKRAAGEEADAKKVAKKGNGKKKAKIADKDELAIRVKGESFTDDETD